jgi:hypothetical protein
LHGGTVAGHSKGKGQGATFEVVFPVAKELKVPAESELSAEAEVDFARDPQGL